MNPKISVIVPVYNVEKYLNRCIDSILAQTFTDFELLLIDDGSKDKSGEICDEYARKDRRIRVFHKENGGVASARQLGIDEALGTYSIHADGDDWIEQGMLQSFYDKAIETRADVIISDYYVQRKQVNQYVSQKLRSTVPMEVLKDILENRLFGALWHKFIRHSLYKQYNIKFIPNINYCEDVLVLIQLLQKNIIIDYLPKAFYHYSDDNTSSITRTANIKTYHQCQLFIQEYQRLLPDSFLSIIRVTALCIKIGAVRDNVIDEKEFRTWYPSKIMDILSPRLGKREKLFYLLTFCGLYGIGKKIL